MAQTALCRAGCSFLLWLAALGALPAPSSCPVSLPSLSGPWSIECLHQGSQHSMDAQWLSLQYTSPLHLAQRTQDRRLKKEGQRCRPSLPERGRLPEQGFGQGPRAGRQSPAAALRAQKREDSGLRAPRRTRAANYTGHFIEASRPTTSDIDAGVSGTWVQTSGATTT